METSTIYVCMVNAQVEDSTLPIFNMDGILVQDSDWNAKLSASLAELLEKKLLCDLGIVCGVQNDVNNLKTNEVVMVHRCILAGASETIRKLSIGGQVYNLVKINGIDISPQCWNNVLEFVYKAKTEVAGKDLCDVRKASQVLQIKPLEKAVDIYHANIQRCVCSKKKDSGGSLNLNEDLAESEVDANIYTVYDSTWLVTLFEGMLDLLVKQSLCNMTIITEKQEKVAAEILAHLCMLVASSSTIKELVLQGNETYNSVKIDSITYNTWLYLLEYVYTSRVSIVKSNIPEVWIASQLLQIDGLANAVAPFASQMGASITGQLQSGGPHIKTAEDIGDDSSEQSSDILQSDANLASIKKEAMLSQIHSQSSSISGISSPPTTPTDLHAIKHEKDISVEISQDHFSADSSCTTQNLFLQDASNPSGLVSIAYDPTTIVTGSSADQGHPTEIHSLQSTNGVIDTGAQLLVNHVLRGDQLQSATVGGQLTSPVVNISLAGLATDAMSVGGLAQAVGTQLLVPQVSPGELTSIQVSGMPANATGLAGPGQIVNTIQPDGTTAMLWVPNQMLPVINNQIQQQAISPTAQILKAEGVGNNGGGDGATLLSSKTDIISGSGIVNAVESENLIENHQDNETLMSIENKEGTSAAEGNGDNSCLYFCNKCAHVFSQKTFLDKHKCLRGSGGGDGDASNTMGPVSPSQIQNDLNKLMCKYCKKIFSRTWTLNVHLRTHTGERPYKCKFCSKAFSDKSNMRQHSLIHTSRKEYNCPKCNQAFAQKRYMKKHYMETCRRKFAGGTKLEVQAKQFHTGQTQEASTRSKLEIQAKQYHAVQQTQLAATQQPSSTATTHQDQSQVEYITMRYTTTTGNHLASGKSGDNESEVTLLLEAEDDTDLGGGGSGDEQDDGLDTDDTGVGNSGMISVGGSSNSELNIKCDIDLGKQTTLVDSTVDSKGGDSVDTSNSGSGWDTSIMMTQGSDEGRDVDEEDVHNEMNEMIDNDNASGDESELGEISLSGHHDDEEDEEEGMKSTITSTTSTAALVLTPTSSEGKSPVLSCKDCKRSFKTERQKKSHRCMDF